MRRQQGKAISAAEQADWEQDHPGQQFPKHECGLTDRAYTDLARWRRQRAQRRERLARSH
jgi:hypothetical protein